MKKLLIWLRAMRAPFFLASIVPVLVGASLAARENVYHWSALVYGLIIVVSSQAGSNMLNDYYDALGSDAINCNLTPFSGGSRLIQYGIVSRKSYLHGSIVAFGIALIFAMILSGVYHNFYILGLTFLGVMIGICYSGCFVMGMGRGWGEIMVGVAFGPLAVMGSFLLQTNYISWESFLAGLPVGFLIMGVLILNEFPDIHADRESGKRNWVVSLGIQKGALVYLATVVMAYLTLLACVLTRMLPVHVLYSYLTIPLACWIVLRLKRYRDRVPEIIPALAGNIGLHLVTGLLMCYGLLR